MKKLGCLALAASMVFGAIGAANAATEVKMTGDARVYGNFFANRNFTGWNKTGTKTEDSFEIWERFRLRSDFVASEAVKFRLGIKVEDTWGHGTFTAANPQVAARAAIRPGNMVVRVSRLGLCRARISTCSGSGRVDCSAAKACTMLVA